MSRPRIQDEFTLLPISRQRKRQLRCERDGLCTQCARPAAPGGKYCMRCRRIDNKRYQKKKAKAQA